MTIPEPTKESLFALSHRLGKSQAQLQRLFAAGRDKKHDKYRDGPFLSIFKDACALVHEAEVANAPYLPELLDAVQQIHDFGVAYAYRDPGMFEFMPSWAHNNQGGRPLVKDISGLNLPIFHTLTMFARDFGLRSGVIDEDAKLRLVPWNESMNRHPKSSRMARFRVNLPNLSASLANPVATAVYDARCEISSTHTVSPIGIQVSDGGSFLAMIGACGWKNRTPGLNYYFLDKDDNPETSFPDHHLLEVGLANVASHMLLDERRRLIFIADGERVKSYTWGGPNGSYRNEVLPVHTLNSRHSSGPMMILPNGAIVRAGVGGANVWRVSELETHGGNGKRVIGRKIAEFDSWRDDPEEIELSSGSFPNSKIQFADRPTFRPGIWRHLVATPSTMICTEPFRTAKSYGCVSIDLETGKMPARYLGHGASIADFAVSSGDPQVFVTACSDGYARMYDVRKPLPVLTLDACGGAAFCEAVAFSHPDGIPTVFSGSINQEQIKVWDLRARACVYELATGNNAVQSLAWDSKYNSLYAATECMYMDRLGFHHSYRPGVMPRPPRPPRYGSEDEDDEDGEDDEEEGDFEHCWPSMAFHAENYFGYMFDAGDHRIYRYAFKQDPNTSVLPEYGDAAPGDMDDFW